MGFSWFGRIDRLSPQGGIACVLSWSGQPWLSLNSSKIGLEVRWLGFTSTCRSTGRDRREYSGRYRRGGRILAAWGGSQCQFLLGGPNGGQMAWIISWHSLLRLLTGLRTIHPQVVVFGKRKLLLRSLTGRIVLLSSQFFSVLLDSGIRGYVLFEKGRCGHGNYSCDGFACLLPR